MNYKIITEASCDMPKEFQEQNDITILPIEVNFNGDLYPEGLPNDEFYNSLSLSSSTITSSGVASLWDLMYFTSSIIKAPSAKVVTRESQM